MNVYVPSYYLKFKCIADGCKYTCCKGWEIDVDDISLERYAQYPRINKHIKDGQFILDENECCPFLRSDGLCQMIIDYGEEFLCDICSDHPRFRNYYDNHIEMGLGLCCEAAVKLILDYEDNFQLINLDSPSDTIETPELISFFQCGKEDLISKINEIYISDLDSTSRAKIYYKLERLDETWGTMLQHLITNPVMVSKRDEFIALNESKFIQLIIYFLYRYKDCYVFAIESIYLIADLCVSGFDLYEVVRMYSSEVEYSDENIDYLLNDLFN